MAVVRAGNVSVEILAFDFTASLRPWICVCLYVCLSLLWFIPGNDRKINSYREQLSVNMDLSFSFSVFVFLCPVSSVTRRFAEYGPENIRIKSIPVTPLVSEITF